MPGGGPLAAVTVVICARNAAGVLGRAIASVHGQQYPGEVRLLVVDNGSTDGTAFSAREAGAEVIACPTPGVAAARDAGWRHAPTPLVAYLDADCEAPPHWLARLAGRFAAEPTLGAAGLRLLSPDPQTLAERHIIETGVLDTDFFWERNWLQWPFVVTAGMVVRRKALEAIGGFEVTMGRATGEDADLCWRLERTGWRVEYHPDIVVLHHHRATVPAMLRQVHWYGLGMAEIFARWHKAMGHPRYIDPAVYRRLARGLVMALPALVLRRDPYERWRPALEAADAAVFLAGKWRGAWRHRVLFL